MPSKESPKSNRQALIALLCFVVIVGVAYFVINPSISGLKEVNAKIDAKNQEISTLKANINTLNTLKTQLEQAKDTANKLELAVPTKDDIPEILVQIENMAKDSGLKINSIQTTNEDTQGYVPISVSLQGDYIGFSKFLSELETNIRPMTIQTINMASAKQEEAPNIINFTLGIEVLRAD